MARVAGVEIPDDKRIEIALTYIYGIGRSTANEILEKVSISPDKRTHELENEDLAKLRSTIDSDYAVEGELRKVVNQNIKRLKETRSYRGIRHEKGLPVRGQKTQTNARTRKGKKK